MPQKTTIAIEKSTVKKLQEFGHKGQTYDSVILDLLEHVEE
jgi:hypothetical protein